jgi:hypothetical protein
VAMAAAARSLIEAIGSRVRRSPGRSVFSRDFAPKLGFCNVAQNYRPAQLRSSSRGTELSLRTIFEAQDRSNWHSASCFLSLGGGVSRRSNFDVRMRRPLEPDGGVEEEG